MRRRDTRSFGGPDAAARRTYPCPTLAGYPPYGWCVCVLASAMLSTYAEAERDPG
jgi:hypothetical protein